MVWSKNKKNKYTPANPSFTIYKSGVEGGIKFIARTCFPDVVTRRSTLKYTYEPGHEETNNEFSNRSDTNRGVQVQKMASGWKFKI